MLTFGSKLNRSYTFYVPFMDMYTEVTTLFNKSNTYIGFNIDPTIYQKHRNGEVQSHIYKDLSESVFATTFLDLRNYKSKSLDLKLQFNNILPQFKNKIQYKCNETIKVSKVKTNNGEFESCLYMYVLGFQDYGNDFLFFLAERQHIDVALDKKLVRTSGLQLCSNNIYDDLLQTVDYYNSQETSTPAISVEESMKSIFSGKKNINIRRV